MSSIRTKPLWLFWARSCLNTGRRLSCKKQTAGVQGNSPRQPQKRHQPSPHSPRAWPSADAMQVRRRQLHGRLLSSLAGIVLYLLPHFHLWSLQNPRLSRSVHLTSKQSSFSLEVVGYVDENQPQYPFTILGSPVPFFKCTKESPAHVPTPSPAFASLFTPLTTTSSSPLILPDPP